jgi:[acyl-carrier-protein] S-malonyltransferase
MIEQGVDHFMEIGPKDVLTKLVKRIAPDADAINVGDAASIEALAE